MPSPFYNGSKAWGFRDTSVVSGNIAGSLGLAERQSASHQPIPTVHFGGMRITCPVQVTGTSRDVIACRYPRGKMRPGS